MPETGEPTPKPKEEITGAGFFLSRIEIAALRYMQQSEGKKIAQLLKSNGFVVIHDKGCFLSTQGNSLAQKAERLCIPSSGVNTALWMVELVEHHKDCLY